MGLLRIKGIKIIEIFFKYSITILTRTSQTLFSLVQAYQYNESTYSNSVYPYSVHQSIVATTGADSIHYR